MLVPDLHEFELGVWKATLIHLVHILDAQGGDSVATFNMRSDFLTQLIHHWLLFDEPIMPDTARSLHSAPILFVGFRTTLHL